MSKGLKLLTLMGLALLLIIIRASFLPLELNERGIVLGVGIDYDQKTATYNLAVEIATPKQNAMGSESSASQGSQKMVEGSGKSVGLAIRNLFNSFGKTPSFGECGIIILGQECIEQTSLQQTLDYFVSSGSFRDGTVVVACEGQARETLQKRSQVDEYVSFALQTLLVDSGNRAQIQYTTLNSTAQSFYDRSKSCFLNLIRFEAESIGEEASEGSSSQGKGKQGKFLTGQMALFSDGRYVGELNREEVNGLNLCDKKKIFCVFVDEENPNQKALALDKKRVKRAIEISSGKVLVKIELNLGLRELRTDSVGEVITLRRKENSLLSEGQKQGAERQATEAVKKAFAKSTETKCDFFGIKNALYAKYGEEYIDELEGGDFWGNLKLVAVTECDG